MAVEIPLLQIKKIKMSESERAEIKTKLEQLARHLTITEKNQDELALVQMGQGKALERIEHALIGSDMNKNEGLVSELILAKNKIETLEGIINIHKVYFALLGIFVVATGILSYIGKSFLK